MRAFKTITLTGESRPAFGSSPDVVASMNSYCAEAARLGMTHLQVNHLPDPHHVILREQPDNYYAWFADYGPALDQFVSSDLNHGIYPQELLSRNLTYLIGLAETAVSHGIHPMLMLCEPRFVPERFFETHPELRGPRVDNPFFSDVPWYAMCTNHPVVREHYQQMMSRLMQHVPTLAGISVFTHDSGAGFCHSQGLYAGANGCHRCRRCGAGERVADFLGLLQSVGAEINPNFRVSLATGVEGAERDAFLAAAPEGVTGEVQGTWSWLGGLEDQWAWSQHGASIEHVGYATARREREQEFASRLDKVKACNKPTIAICSMPTDGFYLPIRYVPHPFQNLQILSTLRDMDVEHLSCKGGLTTPDQVRYDINRETFASFLNDPTEPADQLMSRIATQWVGPSHEGLLVDAWRLLDEAHRRRSLWCWALPREIPFMPSPLVPAPDSLDISEYAYADHPGLACIDRMHGRHRLDSLRRDEIERAWIISNHVDEVLPRIVQAIAQLEALAQESTSDAARHCIQEQLRHARHFLLWQRSTHNWCEAGRWLAPAPPDPTGPTTSTITPTASGKPVPQRTLQAVIDDEISVTESLAEMYQDNPNALFAMAPIDGMLYARGPGFVEQLKQRAHVMRTHRDDTPSPICLPDLKHHIKKPSPVSNGMNHPEPVAS